MLLRTIAQVALLLHGQTRTSGGKSCIRVLAYEIRVRVLALPALPASTPRPTPAPASTVQGVSIPRRRRPRVSTARRGSFRRRARARARAARQGRARSASQRASRAWPESFRRWARAAWTAAPASTRGRWVRRAARRASTARRGRGLPRGRQSGRRVRCALLGGTRRQAPTALLVLPERFLRIVRLLLHILSESSSLIPCPNSRSSVASVTTCRSDKRRLCPTSRAAKRLRGVKDG